MAESLRNINAWLRDFPQDGHSLAVGEGGLELVVLDEKNREVGSIEIGGVPEKDWISRFSEDAERELIEDGVDTACAGDIAGEAESIIREHLGKSPSSGSNRETPNHG